MGKDALELQLEAVMTALVNPFRLKGKDKRCSFTFFSETKEGKTRHYGKPSDAMRVVHKDINRLLWFVIGDNAQVSFGNATGGMPYSSVIMNVAPHTRSRYFYLLDLKSAFEHVSPVKLAVALRFIEPALAELMPMTQFLKDFCMHPKRGGLVQGAPASPALFNAYAAVWIDRFIQQLCMRYKGLKYTRFIDDLTISSTQPIPRRVRKEIRDIIARAGFMINRKKAQLLDLFVGPVTITGIVFYRGKLGEQARWGLTEKFMKGAREALSLPTPLSNEKDREVLLGFDAYFYNLRGAPFTKDALELQRAIQGKLGHLDWHFADKKRRARNYGVQTRSRDRFGRRFFPPGFIDELRERIPIAEVVARKVKLRQHRGGREFSGLCPFHNEKTPSFTIAAHRVMPFYHCFGCGEHGDVFGFVMKTSGLSFPEAVKELADFYNIPIP